MNNKTYRMLVNGTLVDARGGETVQILNPADEEVVAECAWASASDATSAVDAAVEAAPGWRATSPADRGDVVRELARRLRQNAEEIAALETADVGNPVDVSRFDIDGAAEAMEYFAGLARELKGMTLPVGRGWHFTVREPFGVVVRIIPFNHPILFAGSKIAAPLVAGNTVILKPPPQAPLSSLRLAELACDLFPPGVLNVVPGDGPTVGNALVTDDRVRRIAFTGSVETGKVIVRASSEHLAQVSLELGGKNPLIVFPDADIALAADAAVRAMNFAWQGQSCGSASRLFAHESIIDELTSEVVSRVEAIRVGPPDQERTDMGPIISQQQLERVKSYVEIGVQEGADLLTGGEAPQGSEFQRGYWFTPTVFGGVTSNMRIAQEEIFGPVLSVLPWSEEEDVVRKANSVGFGLTANVWTRDIDTAMRMIPQLEAGYCYVNGRGEHFLGLPFGGYKQSGLGREEALDELLSYTETKSVSVLPTS